LRALAELFPQSMLEFDKWADRFELYKLSRVNRGRAILGKVGQKLVQTNVGEMA
jgi:hypothetical protein